MAAYIPPGWPTGVHPPGSEDFEATAIAWLLDVVPPDFRLHGVLRRHPAALAAMARHHTEACVEGARAGYRMARTELGEALPPHAIDAVLAAYRTEGRRLASTAKAVSLIEQALRGDVFTPKLRSDHKPLPQPQPRQRGHAAGRPGPRARQAFRLVCAIARFYRGRLRTRAGWSGAVRAGGAASTIHLRKKLISV